MAVPSISNPQVVGEGVRFTATLDGTSHEFIAGKEALEDVAYEMLDDPAALLVAFGKHEAQVAEAAGKAFGSAAGRPVLLGSLL